MNTEIIRLTNRCFDENDLFRAAKIIKNGGLVVFPTETVYGLGADATNPEAARKIFQAKGRPSDNPLIIHVAYPDDAEAYAYTSATYYKLAEKFMPGPITVIMPSKDTVPKETRGGLPTVAVRCPENTVAHLLIEASGVPIAAPSANLSGSPSPTTAEHVIDDMMGRVDMIIDGGACDFGLESTIVKIDEDGGLTLLRPGKITAEELFEYIGEVKIANAVTDKLRDGETALSPGMKYRHYAPRAEVLLLDGDTDEAIRYIKENSTEGIAVIAYDEDVSAYLAALPSAYVYPFGERADETEQAGLLFSILRDADKHDFKRIYAPLPNPKGVGLALYNRMIRAAAHKIIKL